MSEPHSPLRYPGGKATLVPLLASLLKANGLTEGCYVEPYAGGAGAALGLLFGEHVGQIHINDIDPRIYAFWWAILNRTSAFLDALDHTPITIDEWRIQRDIYLHPNRHSRTRLGFATFFLNRCNRSGILVNGGPIGGIHQSGKWKIDARFNRVKLRQRIERVIQYKERIQISNEDAVALLKSISRSTKQAAKTFVYLDPPYYKKGACLYLNAYNHNDHLKLFRLLNASTNYQWVMSYDNAPQIRGIYADFSQIDFNLDYTAYDRRQGKELLIFVDRLKTADALAQLGSLPA